MNLNICLAKAVAAACLFGAPGAVASAAGSPTAVTRLGAVSPSGSSVAILRRDGALTSALVLDHDGRQLKSYNLSNSDVSDLAFYDEDHLAVTRLVINPGGRVTRRQFVPEAAAIDLHTDRSAYLLQSTRNTAPVIIGGLQRVGTWNNRATVFLRGLMAGPGFALFAADLETGVGDRLSYPTLDALEFLTSGSGSILARTVFDDRRLGARSEIAQGAGWKAAPASTDGYRLRGLSPDGRGALLQGEGRLEVVSLGDASAADLPAPPGRAFDELLIGRDDRLRAARLVGVAPEYVFFDPRLQKTWEAGSAQLPGRTLILHSVSADGGSSVVRAAGADTAEVLYWIKDGAPPVMLGVAQPDLPPARVAPRRIVTLNARDGLALPSVLTLPPGPVRTPPPVVVVAPAAPGDTASSAFDRLRQGLAEAGYAVLAVTPRGSLVSRQSYEAGRGAFLQGMRTDLLDALGDASRRGLVDGGRACIMGADFGGYTAYGLAGDPGTVFRCAIVENPLISLDETVRWPDPDCRGCDWLQVKDLRRAMGVDPQARTPHITAPDLLKTATPPKGPLLLVRSPLPEDDARHTDLLAASLVRQGRPVQVVKLSEDEGAAGKQKLSAIVAFLAKADPP